MEILKELTELNGVSGCEDEVREYIVSKIERYIDNLEIDSIGNLYAYKKKKNSKPKVIVSAHMDEVGLMVTGYDNEGNLKFDMVGGIDERILLNKRVFIGRKRICGVIGSKPFHLQEKDERKSNIKLKNMYIDIGAKSKEETERVVPLGEYVAFCSEYKEFGSGCIKAKALDDRVGCSILMELLTKEYNLDIVFCFTVQEEVGLRGARIAANRLKPDIALVLEGTTCSDVAGISEHEYSTRLGKGAVLSIMDRTSVSDKKLLKLITDTAKKENIPYQYKQTISGGNDAGAIQVSGKGVRVASISVPCRYIHTPVSVMKIEDYKSCKNLADKVLKSLEGMESFV